MARAHSHPWQFKARFRRHAFGWRSQPPMRRLREATAEIRKAARQDPVLAAEGAVTLIERLSPALEHVDSSSGAIGTAVNYAIAQLVPIVAAAPADAPAREAWLERLWAALQADQMPYIESLGDHWGELCATKPVASAWADRLIGSTRLALGPDRKLHGHFDGTSACLSALHFAGRFPEILDLLQADAIWPYKRWAVKALADTGRRAEAIRYAEACRGRWASDTEVDLECEAILLSSGMNDEALALASRTPCDPRTLTRAARDLAEDEPAFATGAGLLALHWLVQGYGYEITGADVRAAYSSTMKAAEASGSAPDVRERIRKIVGAEKPGGFVSTELGRELRP